MKRHLNDSDRKVLETLRRLGEASRVEIAVETGLTKPAVTQIVKSLSDRGLIAERAPRRGARGQPARPLALEADGGLSAGVNFSRTYLEVGLVNLSGQPVGFRRIPLPQADVETIVHLAETGICDLLAACKLPRERLIGVGYSVPGDFSPDGGLVSHVYFPKLYGVRVREAMAAQSSLPVYVENDGRACAIGERIVGVGRKARTFMLVHIGHGIGGGLIIEGQLYRGARGNAGPIGSFFPLGQPRPSGQDLLETLAAHRIDCRDFDALEDLRLEECAPLQTWIERAAAALAETLPKVASVFDPEVMILAGRLPPALLEALVARIDINKAMQVAFPNAYPIARPALVASQLGAKAGIIGAASLPIQDCFLPYTKLQKL